MFALPFVFVPFIINFPAGLLVYWITTNTWTIGQQLLIRKVLPPPHLKDKEGHEIPEPEEEKQGGLSGMIASIRESAGLSPEDLSDGREGRSGGGRGGARGAGGAEGGGKRGGPEARAAEEGRRQAG